MMVGMFGDILLAIPDASFGGAVSVVA